MSTTLRLSKAKETAKKMTDFIKRLDVQHGQEVRVPTARQAWLPCIMASFLFLSWGFAYGILDTMNSHVKDLMGLTQAESSYLAVVYYSAYPIASFFVASRTIRFGGYRVTFILGLVIFALGNFIVSAAAGAFSYLGMVASYFVIGLGVATLERSANPYAVRCGPDQGRAVRINLCQLWAGVGTVIAPLVARAAVLNAVSTQDEVTILAVVPNGDKMESTIALYRMVGGSVIGISAIFSAIFFRTHWVPEVPSDHNLEKYGFWKHPIWRNGKIWLGVFGNVANLSCQVTVAQFIMGYAKEVNGDSRQTAAYYLMGAQINFVLGRFAFAGLLLLFKAKLKQRSLLLGFIAGCIGFTTAAIPTKHFAGIMQLIMVMFFEGPLFPTIFETATNGLGKHSSLGEDIMISSISGGAILPPIVGRLADATTIAKGFSLVTTCFCFVAVYIVAINAYRPFKLSVDADNETLKDVETASFSSDIVMTEQSPASSRGDAPAPDPEAARERVAELRAQLKNGDPSEVVTVEDTGEHKKEEAEK